MIPANRETIVHVQNHTQSSGRKEVGMTSPEAGSRLSSVGRCVLWLVWISSLGIAASSASALFLWSLDAATGSRFAHPWLLYVLPVAGGFVGWVYHRWGKTAEAGNNLLIEQIHEADGRVPFRMAPLILCSTVVTHWFGGSAGREGTAVQMGGGIAAAFGRWFGMDRDSQRLFLMAGISAGFAAVFGTPLAGAVFAIEVLRTGRLEYRALMPCLLAAWVGDRACLAWGVEHTHYVVHSDVFIGDPWVWGKVGLLGLAAGWVSALFSELVHGVQACFRVLIRWTPMRPVVGGLLVIALVHLAGTREYLGLGVWSVNPEDATIPGFFSSGGIHHSAWIWKVVFTAVTLGCGFKGGEVTPLFFIGAALGSSAAGFLNGPVDLFAAVGFVAVFAGASNSPLSSAIMGMELFGAEYGAWIGVGCLLAYLGSGHTGIYSSQRVAVPGRGLEWIPRDLTLRQLRRIRPGVVRRMLDHVSDRLSFPPAFRSEHQRIMKQDHHIKHQESGMIRIYMKPDERRDVPGWAGLFGGRPLYRELVAAALSEGAVSAVAHHTHFGFCSHGTAETGDVAAAKPDLTMCVEIIGDRQVLEAFCIRHAECLAGRVVVYRQLERWEVLPGA